MLKLLIQRLCQEHVVFTVLVVLLPLFGPIIERWIRRWRMIHDRGCQDAQSKASIKDPILGIDFLYDALFGKPPERHLENSFKTFQRLGLTYIVDRWTWTTIYTCDSQNIRHMLTSGCENFDLPKIRISCLDSLFGKGIFSMTGHSWTQNRALLRQGFKKRDQSAFVESLERHFSVFKKRIPIDTEVDLHPLFLGLTMDIATEFLLGHSTRILDATEDHSQEQQFVEDYILCSTDFVQQTQLGPLSAFKPNRKVKQAKKRMLKYVDDFIHTALQLPASEAQETSLLHHLVATTEDHSALRAQVLHILLASRDTTAGLLSNLFFVLAKHPRIYTKLREEVLRISGDNAPTTAQLKEMTYLKWCINESLRLHPVIPSNAREALRDTTLPHGGGKDGTAPLFVPKGVIVIYTVYAMHRTATVFGADAEEFVPERWAGLRPGWNYLPFNGGNRTCLGQQYALLEASYIVARMAQTFETLESRDEEEWAELYALAMCPKNGTKVAVTG